MERTNLVVLLKRNESKYVIINSKYLIIHFFEIDFSPKIKIYFLSFLIQKLSLVEVLEIT